MYVLPPLYLSFLIILIPFQLEWLTALPWPSSSSPSTTSLEGLETLKDRSFLTRAREQLDNDHFGLEKIKRRLIEYLAVVRLRLLAAEAEALKEKKDLQLKESQEKAVVLANKPSKGIDAKSPPSTAVARPMKKANPVKGPILLYVVFFHLTKKVLVCSTIFYQKVCRSSRNRKDFTRPVHCSCSQQAIPTYFTGWGP